jgi:hypothetical protein
MGGLLRQVATVEVPAVVAFVPVDHFKADASATAEVRIKDVANALRGFPEESAPATAMTVHVLRAAADSDAKVVRQMGTRAYISLAHVWELLKRQRNGEAGVLVTSQGSSNVFYCRGSGGAWVIKVWSSSSVRDVVSGSLAFGGWIISANGLDEHPAWADDPDSPAAYRPGYSSLADRRFFTLGAWS